MEDKYYGQQCQDEKLNKKFRCLHTFLVNQVINFCKTHNIVIDEFHLFADSLAESIKYGSWQSCTDSSFEFIKFTDDYKKIYIDTDSDFIHSLSEKDIEKIEMEQKPFMFSM